MSETPKNILFWGEFLGFAGGIERYEFQSAEILRRHGFHIDCAGWKPSRDEQIFRAGFDRVLSPAEAIRNNCEYDLVVLHKPLPTNMLSVLRSRFGERVVFFAHDHDVYCPRRHYYTPFGRRNCRRAFHPVRCGLCSLATAPRNRVDGPLTQEIRLRELAKHHAVVLSEFMRDNLLRNGFSPEKTRVIHPVARISAEQKVFCPNALTRLVFLGQLVRGKGCDLLLDALAETNAQFTLRIVGAGGDEAFLRKRCRRNGLADKTEFAGWLSDPESCWQDADLAVSPSRWQEPFGLCGLEALAHGTPVVAFDVGGVREWLADGETGLLAPEGDVATLRNAIERLCERRDLLAKFGANGRALVRERFGEERFVQAMKQLAEDVR